MEELDATYFMVPKGLSGNHIVPSLNGGLTRREELRQRRFIDKTIVEKKNLTDKGWLDGSRAVKGILSPPGGGNSDPQVGRESLYLQFDGQIMFIFVVVR